jgi:hypothetical protein
MRKITIKIGKVELTAKLLDTPTADAVQEVPLYAFLRSTR